MPPVVILIGSLRQERLLVTAVAGGPPGNRPLVEGLRADPRTLGRLEVSRGAAILLDPRVGEEVAQPGRLPRAVARFLDRHRAHPTAVWAPARWLDPHRMVALSRLGIRDIIVEGENDGPELLRSIVQRLLAKHRAAAFLSRLPPGVPGSVRDALSEWLRGEVAPLTPPTLAQRLRCDRRTLYRRFRNWGLPPPGECFTWVRLYLAMSALEEGDTVERAAWRAGISSASALRRALRARLRETGDAAGAGRTSEFLLSAMEARLLEARCAETRSAPPNDP